MNLRGWTELELAKRCGLGKKTINNLVNERHPPNIETTDAIARAFGLWGWQLLMPSLPKDLESDGTLGRLITAYKDSSAEGPKIILQIAEREATYKKAS